MGLEWHLVSRECIELVTEKLPRMGWSGCFASTILKEIREKPWCHTTALPNFAESVARNELMRKYE
jgi:cyanamide hydratase